MPAIHAKLHAVDERTPERLELARAIERHRDVAAREKAHADAEGRAYGETVSARDAVAKAQAELGEARAVSVQRRIDKAMGKPGDEPPPVRAAREALADAEEALEEANAAKSALVMGSGELGQVVEVAAMSVREAVRNVIKSEPAVQRLIEDHLVVSRAYADVRAVLTYLAAEGCLPDNAKAWAAEQNFRDLTGAQHWRDFVKALSNDPDAQWHGGTRH